MKARTRNILLAADAALKGDGYAALESLGEVVLSDEICDAAYEGENPALMNRPGWRCLSMCLAAALCEAGDL